MAFLVSPAPWPKPRARAHHSRYCSGRGLLEPVSRAPGPDEPLQLVRLDPDELVDPPISPEGKQLAGQLHGPACDPETQDAPVWLQRGEGEPPHLVVCHGAVW